MCTRLSEPLQRICLPAWSRPEAWRDGGGSVADLELSGIQYTMGGGAHCERHLITRKSAPAELAGAAKTAKTSHSAQQSQI